MGMEKKAKQKQVIRIVLIILFIIAFVLTQYFLNRVVPYKDEHTLGNTPGNLNNGGLFCENEGKIYFSNLEDEGRLYVMDSNLDNIKKVYDDNASYINAAGRYLFYTRRNDKMGVSGILNFSNTGLYRMKKNGTALDRLYEEPTQAACLYGNYVYYQHYDKKQGLQLYKAKIDGKEDIQLSDEGVMPCSVDADRIYYNGVDDDHAIYAMSIQGGDGELVYDGNCYMVTVSGDDLYFLDMNQNYALARVSKDGGEAEIVVQEQICTYNISADGQKIYYQTDGGEENGLYEYDVDAKESELLEEGNFNYLHLTENYLFFETYNQTQAYVMNLDNGKIEEFNPPVEERE